MAKLSAFADEVSESFAEQAKFLVEQGVGYIEPRFVDRKNIMDLNSDELAGAKKLLDDNGIKVSAIGSPIGKVKLDEDFETHLDKFRHSVELAQFFETRLIRLFSYYPPDGECIDDYLDEVVARFGRKLEILGDADIVMAHENETGIFGHSAANNAKLVESVDSEKLRLAFDSGNFVWGEKNVDSFNTCWPVMKPYVAHIHIKDWKVGATVGAVPGEGDGQIPELLGGLAAMGYDGCITMEPHLQVGGQFGGSTSPEQYATAIAAVRRIANEVGLELE